MVLYLQDLGEVPKGQKTQSNEASLNTAHGSRPPAMNGESQNPVEDQIVWQLEMWKRAEMAKFLAHLK